MNKYELAVVVSAKIEDEERAAVVDKCKALIERFVLLFHPVRCGAHRSRGD